MTSKTTATALAAANNPRLGIALCLLSMLIFACQDGITKVLVRHLPVAELVMVRYWVFVLFALVVCRSQGGVRAASRSASPWRQVVRSLLGVGEIAVFGLALRYLGLAETHALYAVFPLMTLGLARVFLGERMVGRQWLAAAVGFGGTLLILRPGMGVFEPAALIPLAAALTFAFFNILSRRISQTDSFATTTLYMALVGAVAATSAGLPAWVTPTPHEAMLMSIVAVSGVIAQLLLIQALKYAQASTLQPFNYSLLAFATLIGLIVFGETPTLWTIIGALLILLAGLYSIRPKAL
ncbi:DMT family transporter [Pseudomonas nicosulfuronedens]|uniref:DMT family transporter n=1 Tax=Pseudomonas nicosulfuronedens TaxID=2571105 RepID=A0A5R9RC42_9PSED|nr:DMT family transporter [Pseudomonas nicosulfuronedens]MDH1011093.1 DMT family transporter [Pseudomonas nicosulfuronedens]MDH1981188.1 DMT family transporter [Pseudomonas nicosulfuronedens]MDH2026863.1 DMT family transporter [Pseudomonas nicosulfuronedens]TLX79558.1 DMT family transporter [Pseudomonas nicosulfuronedens]